MTQDFHLTPDKFYRCKPDFPRCQLITNTPSQSLRAAPPGGELGPFEPSNVSWMRCNLNKDCANEKAQCMRVQGNNAVPQLCGQGDVEPFCTNLKICSDESRFLDRKVGAEGANVLYNKCTTAADCKAVGKMCIIPHEDEPD